MNTKTDFEIHNYRSDIDGLRGVAVLSVVVFHAFPQLLPGGFVGVDIFFVISGFLISTIIFQGLEKNSFSFAEFYARRIRRIFPSLILVLLAGLVFGWLFLLPDEFRKLGKHIAAGAGFVSNLILWRESGYFDSAAETKPYLHLWSLGIEEQFYLIWPLLIVVAWRKRVPLLLLCSFFLLTSFVSNIGLTWKHPVAAFYSLFSRYWELMCGSTLAQLILHPSGKVIRCYCRENSLFKKICTRDVMSGVGMFLIVMALIFISKESHFPGWLAVLPTLGAFLIIAAGNRSLLNRSILSWPPLVWVGLISYPLYLWHWFLLTCSRIVSADIPSPITVIFVVALSFILSWLTYRLVEIPIRFNKSPKNRGRFVYVACFLICVIGLSGYAIRLKNGLPFRLPGVLQEMRGDASFGNDSESEYRDWRRGVCFLNPEQVEFIFPEECYPPKISHTISVFLWGDSNAAALIPGLKILQQEGKITFSQFTASSCYPGRPDALCRGVNEQAISRIKKDNPDVILIHAHWADPNNVPEKIIKGLKASFEIIGPDKKSKVVLVGPVPMWRKELSRLIYESYLYERRIPRRLKSQVREETFALEKILSVFSLNEHIRYFSFLDVFCNQEGCLTQVNDHSITCFDSVHLTRAASVFAVDKMKSSLYTDN